MASRARTRHPESMFDVLMTLRKTLEVKIDQFDDSGVDGSSDYRPKSAAPVGMGRISLRTPNWKQKSGLDDLRRGDCCLGIR